MQRAMGVNMGAEDVDTTAERLRLPLDGSPRTAKRAQADIERNSGRDQSSITVRAYVYPPILSAENRRTDII